MAKRVVNGAAVRAIRQALGMSQAELARRVGVKRPTICGMERGGKYLSLAKTREAARVLGVSLEAITTIRLDPDESPEPAEMAS